jgi:hypothetical protein
MRVLVVAFWPTHFMVTTPYIWALRVMSHDVLVAAPADCLATVEGAGLPARLIGPAESQDEPGPRGRQAFGSGLPGVHGGRWDSSWDALAARWTRRIDALLGDTLALIDEWRPDLVICDPVDFSSRIAAGVGGVPVVTHRWGPDVLTSQAQPKAAEELHGLCTELGLQGLPRPALVIDSCPPSLQHPDADEALAVQHIPYGTAGLLPDWAAEPVRRPRVIVTFGTRSLDLDDRLAALTAVVAAVAALPVGEVVATVPAEYHDRLPEFPPRVRLVAPTPLAFLLDSCSAIVHHGGAGTALAAARAGVPQVVVASPGQPVLAACADRVAARGVGIAVSGTAPGNAGEALARVLAEPSFAKQARELRQEILALPRPDEVALTLEALVGLPV